MLTIQSHLRMLYIVKYGCLHRHMVKIFRRELRLHDEQRPRRGTTSHWPLWFWVLRRVNVWMREDGAHIVVVA
jgi:hypothetical protein